MTFIVITVKLLQNKPVGDWISVPSPNVDPQTMTDSVTHRCKFWALRGLNHKPEKTVL